jgi:hypothetical protein
MELSASPDDDGCTDEGHASRWLTFPSPGTVEPSPGIIGPGPGVIAPFLGTAPSLGGPSLGAAASMAPCSGWESTLEVLGGWESTMELLGEAANVASFSSKTLTSHSCSMVQGESQILR